MDAPTRQPAVHIRYSSAEVLPSVPSAPSGVTLDASTAGIDGWAVRGSPHAAGGKNELAGGAIMARIVLDQVVPYSICRAQVQQNRPSFRGSPLLHPAAQPGQPRRDLRTNRGNGVLRPARAAPNRQDLDLASSPRPAQRGRQVPLPVRERGSRPSCQGGHRPGDASFARTGGF